MTDARLAIGDGRLLIQQPKRHSAPELFIFDNKKKSVLIEIASQASKCSIVAGIDKQTLSHAVR